MALRNLIRKLVFILVSIRKIFFQFFTGMKNSKNQALGMISLNKFIDHFIFYALPKIIRHHLINSLIPNNCG